MTDDELFATFGGDYSDDGYPVMQDLASIDTEYMDDEQLFRRRCELNCITDPVEIGKLWAEERQLREGKR